MAQTPEKRVKAIVTKQLKEIGAYYFYPMSGGFGKSGVPDIICCYRGRFVAIECKAGNNKTTALQDKNIEDIIKQGGIALIVNEANANTIGAVLTVSIAPDI